MLIEIIFFFSIYCSEVPQFAFTWIIRMQLANLFSIYWSDKFWRERCHILHLQIIFYCKRQKVVPSYQNKLLIILLSKSKNTWMIVFLKMYLLLKFRPVPQFAFTWIIRMQLANGDSDPDWISKIHKYCLMRLSFIQYIALNFLHEDLLNDKFRIERCHILHLQIIFYCKRQKVVPSYQNKLLIILLSKSKNTWMIAFLKMYLLLNF